jgi:hypothetical protein
MVRPAAVLVAILTASVSLGATREDLARARTLFNERKFDQAIAAAELARKTPDTADAAAIVLARAHLERYRQVADPADLGAARAALGSANVEKLGTPDRAEYLIGLGGSLFLEDDFGAAAEIFESAIEIAPAAGEGAREAVLDWYGSAMERWAAPYTTTRRAAMLERLRRMELEQAKNLPRAAAYWLVAALCSGETDTGRRRLPPGCAPCCRRALDALRADRSAREGIIPDKAGRRGGRPREPRNGAARRVGTAQAEMEVGRGSGPGARGSGFKASPLSSFLPLPRHISGTDSHRHRRAAGSATRSAAAGASKSSSCTVRIMRDEGASAASTRSTSIIARFRMSAAVP